MSLINSVSAIISKKTNLDEVVYMDNRTSVDDEISLVDENLKKMIPPPPKNSSTTTAKELKLVAESVKSRSAKEIDLIITVDKEPLELFYKFLKNKKLLFPKHTFDDYYNIVEQYIYALKNYHNRARPEQLAPYHNIELDIMYTDTHDTPSYPSGHTMYAALAAHILSDRYPKYRKDFFDLAKYCGLARILQGVHFPSDNTASFQALEILYPAIKRRFENEERSQKFPVDRQS